MDAEKITIGVLNHDNNIFEKYIAQSLKGLRGNFDLIIEKNKTPAQAYNDIIHKSDNRFWSNVLCGCKKEYISKSKNFNCQFRKIKKNYDF